MSTRLTGVWTDDEALDCLNQITYAQRQSLHDAWQHLKEGQKNYYGMQMWLKIFDDYPYLLLYFDLHDDPSAKNLMVNKVLIYFVHNYLSAVESIIQLSLDDPESAVAVMKRIVNKHREKNVTRNEVNDMVQSVRKFLLHRNPQDEHLSSGLDILFQFMLNTFPTDW